MIRVLEGNDFLIQEAIQEIIEKKFKGIPEDQLPFSIIRDPSSISVVTSTSAFGSTERLILWRFDSFKKIEVFNPYVIPKGTDIIIYANKIDKRLKIVKELESFNAKIELFKDLYPNQVESWILQRKQKIKLNIEPDAVKLLALYYGSNLKDIVLKLDEFKKLNAPITKDIVNITCSQVNTFSIFELQDCVTARNFRKATYVYKQMLKGGHQTIEITRYFISFFDRLIIIKLGNEKLTDSLKYHPFILKKLKDIKFSVKQCLDCLDMLRLAELDIFSGQDDEFVIQNLFFKISKT